ncbi:MAG: N-acetylneuraminate synthase family protein [Treponemataceae bacterium]|nr:N-acetylneuraminate synthase family protein [Treponemataceae bacterium]
MERFFETLSPSPLIIAELGTAHNGSLTKAKELVHAAREAGADCIKLQHFYADEILHPKTGIVPLPGGPIPLYERFKQLEVSLDFLAELKEYVEQQGALFLCTPFGIRSAREIQSLHPKLMKIASPELNYVQLLEEIASYKLPTILSTGVSKLADIELALSFFPEKEVCVLHCVTAYPTPETEYNLLLLENLHAIFGVSVGVSDHSMDAELVPVLATACGARVIEKHFCLSRQDAGLDDPIALPPADFAKLVRAVRSATTVLNERGPTEGKAEILTLWCKKRGASLIKAILGDGQKRLAPAEKANYERTNRSIHAIRDIPAGSILTEKDMAILRTEKELRPGLAPQWFPYLIGKVVKKDIPAGEGIRFDDIV